jgi:hypothetical protein
MNAFLQSLGDYLPSGNLLSGRTAALPRELLGPVEYSARKQRALMTRWSSVLHSKDLPFPWGLLIANPPGPPRRSALSGSSYNLSPSDYLSSEIYC